MRTDSTPEEGSGSQNDFDGAVQASERPSGHT